MSPVTRTSAVASRGTPWHPSDGVGVVVGDRGAGGDVVEGALEVRLGGAVDRPLEHAQRQLRPGGERRRLLDGRRQQLGRLEHLADEAELAGLGGVDEAGPQHEVEGAGQAEHLHEQVVAALVGHQAEAQRAAAEASRRRREPQVARQRQRQPALHGRAVDGGDRRLVDGPQGPVDGLRVHLERAVRRRRIAVAALDHRHAARLLLRVVGVHVVAGAERPTGAGEHDGARLVVGLDLGQQLDQVALHRHREGVEALGMIEGDQQDPGLRSRHVEAGPSVESHARQVARVRSVAVTPGVTRGARHDPCRASSRPTATSASRPTATSTTSTRSTATRRRTSRRSTTAPTRSSCPA